MLRARRNLQTRAVCRDPLRDRCRKKEKRKRQQGTCFLMRSGRQGPSCRSCLRVLAALGQQVLTFCPACMRKDLDLWGEQRKTSKCPPPSAAALLLSLQSSADGSYKDVCWCLGRVLICSGVPFISLLNGSLSQTWDCGGEKNQSSKMPKLFWKTCQMKVVRQKRTWNGLDYLIPTIWRMAYTSAGVPSRQIQHKAWVPAKAGHSSGGCRGWRWGVCNALTVYMLKNLLVLLTSTWRRNLGHNLLRAKVSRRLNL